jgi:hypothetical protein
VAKFMQDFIMPSPVINVNISVCGASRNVTIVIRTMSPIRPARVKNNLNLPENDVVDIPRLALELDTSCTPMHTGIAIDADD